MKKPNRAPVFVGLYPGMCDVARGLGYALAIHGTVATDLDIIACPWTDEAVDAVTLKDALMAHLSACGYGDLMRMELPEDVVQQVLARKEPGTEEGGTRKPHGRLAWNLYMQCGSKVDLSVMPRLVSTCVSPSSIPAGSPPSATASTGMA